MDLEAAVVLVEPARPRVTLGGVARRVVWPIPARANPDSTAGVYVVDNAALHCLRVSINLDDQYMAFWRSCADNTGSCIVYNLDPGGWAYLQPRWPPLSTICAKLQSLSTCGRRAHSVPLAGSVIEIM